MYNEFDLAYAAGYIDGDGCLYIGSYSNSNKIIYEYSIQVSSVKKESCDWLKNKFGGSIRTKEKEGNRRTPYVWTIKNKECIELAHAIRPYLVEKQYECDIFIEFALTITQNNFQPLKEEGINDRLALIEKMRTYRHKEGFIEKNAVTKQFKGIRPSLTPTDMDIAYFAGLIDAEGCFRVKKWSVKNKPNPVYAICLEIGNTKSCFFSWIMMRFGGSISFIEAKTKNRRHSVTWSLSSKRLNFFISRIYYFLKIKKPVCKKVMDFFNTNIPNGGDRHSEAFKTSYASILNQREEIISEIHILNAKGHDSSNC